MPTLLVAKHERMDRTIRERVRQLPTKQEPHEKSESTPLSHPLISSASGTERGEVFYGPTDWLGSRDPMTHIRYTRGSSTELAD
jgi:hypothetical protein